MQGLPAGAAPDLAHFQSVMHAVEQACTAIERHVNPASAEATLLAFRQSTQPYQSCKFILENSQKANARFQAAGAIRDAALREWGFLTIQDKKNLIFFCLNFVMEHSSSIEAYVQGKVSAVAAQLLKRGWMEFSTVEKEAFLTEVQRSVLGVLGLEAQYSGLNLLDSLVSEFSPSTSSAMGLPAEFHDQCKLLLEKNYMKDDAREAIEKLFNKTFYSWAKDAALRVTDGILRCQPSSSEDKVCCAALRLMYQILNWDFKHDIGSTKAGDRKSNHDNSLLKKFEHTIVQPGREWYDILISSGHIEWLVGVYGALRKRLLDDILWFDSPLAVSSRLLIVQLCCLSERIFPSDGGESRKKYLVQLLSTVLTWIEPPRVAAISCGQNESEFLDGCHALLSMAIVTSTVEFDNLLKALRPYGMLQLLSMLTSEIGMAIVDSNGEEDSWCSEAMDILLEFWNVILGRVDSDKVPLSTEGVNACASLFTSLMDCQLKVAAASAYEDDNDSDHFHVSVSSRDEKLSSYALIARAALAVTVPLLARGFSERVHMLLQGNGKVDLTCNLEELYWLLLISGHILTNSGEGETNVVPDAILNNFQDIVETSQHPVVALSWSVINFAKGSLDPQMRSTVFSPRLMEALIWFLARWADTYLMPPEANRKNNDLRCANLPLSSPQTTREILLTFAGENDEGMSLLDTFVQISITALVSYPGETALQELTCHQLLPALVRRRNVCGHLVSLESWRSLANAFANDRVLFSIPSRLQRFLAETLVRSASAIQDPDSANQYVRYLMGPLMAYLVEMSTKNGTKVIGQQPDSILLVSCLLERIRGAARATEPRTQKAIFNMTVAVMNPLLALMDIYKDEAAVVYMILKFAVELVEGQVVFLEAQDTRTLVSFCMQLLQIYSSHNAKKIAVSLSAGLLNELKAEKYKDLRALLQLLTNLCSKDLVDFSSDSSGEDTIDIAEVVYTGLHIVIPLMSSELLKYPKFCHQYFSLLSHMLEVYPEKVAQMNVEAFDHIAGTLNWGIKQQDIEVVEMCLRAVDALASYHYKEASVGKEGLKLHITKKMSTDGSSHKNILSHFLQMLMQLLLFEDFSTELLGAAADAFFPLLLCEQELYQGLVNELIERQPNVELKSRLATSFSCLTSANQLTFSLDRSNRQKFRKNFNKFFIDISAFMKTK